MSTLQNEVALFAKLVACRKQLAQALKERDAVRHLIEHWYEMHWLPPADCLGTEVYEAEKDMKVAMTTWQGHYHDPERDGKEHAPLCKSLTNEHCDCSYYVED